MANWFTRLFVPQTAASRPIPQSGRSAPKGQTPAPEGLGKQRVYDRKQYAYDSVSRALVGKWRDYQAHGRITYDIMRRHPAVAPWYDLILAFIKAAEPTFVAASQDPTEKQKQMADFLNWQFNRLGATGEARDGWMKLVDGFVGQGLQYGFSLAELGIKTENWKGRAMKQVAELRSLPQASLDNGFQPREEFGEVAPSTDGRYNCFDIDDFGKITGVHQYRQNAYSVTIDGKTITSAPDDSVVSWTDGDLLRILHYKHEGGDGNPFGKSIFFGAFYPWSDLYVRERQEQVNLDVNGETILWGSQETDVPSPTFNDQFVTALTEGAGTGLRVITGNKMKVGNTSGSNPDYVKHIKQNKDELRQYIAQTMLVPSEILDTQQEDAANVRDTIQVFVRYRLPSLLKEIEEVFTWQFGKRIIDANYSGVDITDYPRLKLRLHIPDDLRVAGQVITQVLPYMDSDRLGEAMEQMLPAFRREWLPKDHKDSVAEKRPIEKPDPVVDSKSSPPDRTGQRGDGGGAGDGSQVRPGARGSNV